MALKDLALGHAISGWSINEEPVQKDKGEAQGNGEGQKENRVALAKHMSSGKTCPKVDEAKTIWGIL